jgi:NTP pyrophosphatase (non-canonical NTP hydrolase)
MDYYQLEFAVEEWAKARSIIGKASPSTQCLKTASELGELCDAIIKNNRKDQIDAIGDVMVCLIILCRMLELDLTVCLESAYNVIKERTGTSLPNGTFVKDE